MYEYKVMRDQIFTEQGQISFLAVRDRVRELLPLAGAVRMEEVMRSIPGDPWVTFACVDRLVELGEIREIKQECAGHYRVFTFTYESGD